LAGNALAQDTAYRAERVLASNVLALDTTTGRSGYWQAMSWRKILLIGRSRYWQAMRWRWTQLQGGAGIGKQ